MDNLKPEKRSWNMGRIKGKNTAPEILVRKFLYKKGFRYRLHSRSVKGCPDISNKKNKIAIFVNGCFWHRHGCKKTSTPQTNLNFWEDKFEKTIKRDKLNYKFLVDNKWEVIVLWECKIHEIAYLRSKLSKVLDIAKK